MAITYSGEAMGGQGHVRVLFRGRVDEERLARAVHLAIEAEPILGYRFAVDGRRPCWHHTGEKEWAAPFEVFETPDDQCLLDFLADPALPDRPPQVRAGLFRSQNDLLCIKLNHVVMDGGGLFRYLALLSSLYRRLGEEPGYRPPNRVPRRHGPRQVLRHAGLLPAVRALTCLRLPPPALPIPGVSSDRSRQAFVLRQVGAKHLAALLSYAREQGATVNDVLLAAFCRALFATCEAPPGRPFRVEVPVSLRRDLPEESTGDLSNLTGLYAITIDRRPDEPFEETLARVRAGMEREKANRTELGEMLFVEMLLLPGPSFVERLMGRTGYAFSHPSISNLGSIDPRVVDFGPHPVEDVQVFGPILFPPNIGVCVSTFGQRMSLTLHYCSSAVDPDLMEGFLGRFVDELLGAPR